MRILTWRSRAAQSRVAGDGAGDDVAVAAEELRRAVQRQGGAVPGRVLQDRGGEGVVDEHGHAGGGRDDRGDVDLAEGRVLRRLEQHEPGLGPDRRLRPRRFRPGDLDPEQPAGEQVVGAAVERPQGDDVAPLAAGGEQAGRQGGHPGREATQSSVPSSSASPSSKRRTVGLKQARVDGVRRLGAHRPRARRTRSRPRRGRAADRCSRGRSAARARRARRSRGARHGRQ